MASARPNEHKFAGLGHATIEPDGTFSGYASLFGRVDLGKDIVERGAFARSLRTAGPTSIRMLFQHDPNEPIGVWTRDQGRRARPVRARPADHGGRAARARCCR